MGRMGRRRGPLFLGFGSGAAFTDRLLVYSLLWFRWWNRGQHGGRWQPPSERDPPPPPEGYRRRILEILPARFRPVLSQQRKQKAVLREGGMGKRSFAPGLGRGK